MAHPSDKYKMFLNFMYNELGISKEDIKQWIRDAIFEVAENYVQHQFTSYPLDKRVEAMVNNNMCLVVKEGSTVRNYSLSSFIERAIGEAISNKLKISLDFKESEIAETE